MGYNRAKLKMSKSNKNEEVQSRREFFKNAAKKALPIVGAIALMSTPIISNAHESKLENGCDYGCSGGCYHACRESCKGGCKTGCLHSCTGSCKETCSGSSKQRLGWG